MKKIVRSRSEAGQATTEYIFMLLIGVLAAGMVIQFLVKPLVRTGSQAISERVHQMLSDNSQNGMLYHFRIRR